MGVPTAIATSCSEDVPVREALQGAALSVRPSDESTTFRNEYDGAWRRQFISGVAEPLSLSDVPPEWRSAPVVLLGAVAGELRDDLFSAFQNSLLGVTPQGMMRQWDADGLVHAVRWERAEALLAGVDVVVLSEDDLPGPEELSRYTGLVPVIALTHSERGATVYDQGQPHSFPAYSCEATDPTGAGDIFAAAFLLQLHESGDIERAAHFANSAASYVIEARGTTGVPTRSQVERRIALATPSTP